MPSPGAPEAAAAGAVPAASFAPRPLGATGHTLASPLGIGASYGVGADGVEEAFDRGVTYFYWAWRRTAGFGEGLRRLCRTRREKIFITVTSLVPGGMPIRSSVNRTLTALGTDYVDCLQFYLRKERDPFDAQLEPAFDLQRRGLIRHIGVTGHHRPNFPRAAGSPFAAVAHLRYNAIHRGAETDVFPHLPPKGDPARPGIVAFTATSWGKLIKATPESVGGLPVPAAGDCYRFVLSHPGIDCCLTGPADTAQLRHALDAVERGPMDEEELSWMRAVGDRLR